MATARARDYEPVIGLEIHCQLATRSKIFCGCPVRYDAPPNSSTCPVCLGLPGALPVPNRKAVRFAVMMALATGSTVHPVSVFARKNYFYPDLPKGYQITQYAHPLATDGAVEIDTPEGARRISIARIHLEEDAGKVIHDVEPTGRASLVDLNRAGIPLIEIVSGPDLRSAAEARAYMKAVHAIVTGLGICGGNLEQGNFRCDGNISVRRRGETEMGTRVEVKNLNSFRFLDRALTFEADRQVALLEAGGEVRPETRLWDQTHNRTAPMRDKEEPEDYRYFSEPDLPPLCLAPEEIDVIAHSLPELPRARAKRFQRVLGLSEYDAGVLTSSRELADYFEDVANGCGNPKRAANWVMGELLAAVNRLGVRPSALEMTPVRLARLLTLVEEGVINGKTAKALFEIVLETGEDPDETVAARGLAQITDPERLRPVVAAALAASPEKEAALRGGSRKLIGFFVGEVLKATNGRASPQVVRELLVERL